MILRIKLSSLFIFSIAPVSLFISLFSWNGWNTIRIKRHDTLWYNYNHCAQDATYYRTIGVIIGVWKCNIGIFITVIIITVKIYQYYYSKV